MKASAILVISFASLVIVTTASAQAPSEIRSQRIEEKKAAIETRKENVADKIASREAKAQERLEIREERMDTRKESNQNRMELRKERIASKEGQLTVKLAKFKDKQRVQIAERLNKNLNILNERLHNKMFLHIDKLTELLTRLETRISASDQDTSTAQAAISQAKIDIEIAKTAVDTQATKDYAIIATSEARLADDARTARNSLHTDLKAVHELLVKARQSVSAAVSATASTLGGIGNGQ